MLNSHSFKKRVSRWTCLKASFCTSWQCFTVASSFHGLKYISNERKIYQKFVWLICMLSSFTCLIILSYYLYFHYLAAPTKTIVKSQHYPSVLIPFPAITVCPPNKISPRRTKLFLRPFLQHYENATNTSSDEEAILRAISQMNGPLEDNFASHQDMEKLDKILGFGKLSISDFVREMSIECNEWIVKCIWNHRKTSCRDLFSSVLTSEGYCCSFNYGGVHLNNKQMHATGFGLYSGLSMVFDENVFMSRTVQNNFRVLIHDSFCFPQNIRDNFLISRFKETALGMRIIHSRAEYRLRDLAPKTRNCIFRDEYRLKHFGVYTFENCLTKCQLELFYRLCGCIPYYLSFKDLKVCNPVEMLCIKNYSTQVLVQENGYKSPACICPNECDMFLIKTSLTEWHFYPMNETEVELQKGLSDHSTILHIYFAQLHNHLYQKVVSLRALNFTSNIGGLVALFLGSSLISILELCYFFTYRVCKIYTRIRGDTRVLFISKKYLEFNKKSKL